LSFWQRIIGMETPVSAFDFSTAKPSQIKARMAELGLQYQYDDRQIRGMERQVEQLAMTQRELTAANKELRVFRNYYSGMMLRRVAEDMQKRVSNGDDPSVVIAEFSAAVECASKYNPDNDCWDINLAFERVLSLVNDQANPKPGVQCDWDSTIRADDRMSR
jgi:hypothetical protein